MTSTMRFDKWENSLGQPYGTVLQVVQGSTSTESVTTSTSFVDTGLTATITPKSASSKILVLTSQLVRPVDNSQDQAYSQFRLLRGTTGILDLKYGGNATRGAGSAAAFSSNNAMTILDSPETTSATTYKVQHRLVAGLRSEAQFENHKANITLLEIAQ
jgi:hypothetical protein